MSACFFYLFGLSSLVIFLRQEGFKLRISCCSVAIYYFLVSYYNLSPPPAVLKHSLYVGLWPLILSLGVCLAGNRSLPFKKRPYSLRYLKFFQCMKTLILGVFLAIALYVAINLAKKIIQLKLYTLSFYAARAMIPINYLEYCYSKALFLPFALYVFINSKSWFKKFIYLLCFLFVGMATLHQQPFASLIIIIVCSAYIVIHKGFFIKFRYAILCSILVFLAICASVTIYNGSNVSYKNLVMGSYERIFSTEPKLSYPTLVYIDKKEGFGYGRHSFGSLFRKRKGEEPLSRKTLRLFSGTSELPPRGCANTACLVPLYADFRFFGLIFALLLGYFLRLYDNTIQSVLLGFGLENGIKSLCFCSYMASVVLSLNFDLTNFGTSLLSGGMFATAFLATIAAKWEVLPNTNRQETVSASTN